MGLFLRQASLFGHSSIVLEDLSDHEYVENDHEQKRNVRSHQNRYDVRRNGGGKVGRTSSAFGVQVKVEIRYVDDCQDNEADQNNECEMELALEESKAVRVAVQYEREAVECSEHWRPRRRVKDEAAQKLKEFTHRVALNVQVKSHCRARSEQKQKEEQETQVDCALPNVQETHVCLVFQEPSEYYDREDVTWNPH